MVVSDKTKRVTEIIEPVLENMGYELVRVQIMGGGRPVLQIMAERKDGSSVTIDDCADISRSLSVILDVENPIDERYNLEVSSPGLDRPLTKLKDFERFVGKIALVSFVEPLDGRKKLEGKLKGVIDSDIAIEAEGLDVKIPYTNIAKAKLVSSKQSSDISKKVKQTKGR